jgi:nitroreductase
MDALTLLHQRNSAPKLTDPAPDAAALEQILRAALRAPDHGHLHPWRFIAIDGEARQHLGELFAQALLQRKPEATEEEIKKNRLAPLRAPLILVVVARLQDHAKVPRVEQLLSAGCAGHSILLAANALGYGAIWRTGDNSYDANVKAGLGLTEGEEMVGYIYLGTIAGNSKPLPELRTADFLSRWN